MKSKSLDLQVEELKDNYSEKEYLCLLKKVLKSENYKAMYLIALYFDNSPKDILEDKMTPNMYKTILPKNIKWQIKMNSLTNNEEKVPYIWSNIKKYIHNYEKYSTKITMYELLDNINHLVALSNAPVNEIVTYLYDHNIDTSELLQQDIQIDLDNILNKLDNPEDIFFFVLNYRRNINDIELTKFIEKFMELLNKIYDINGYISMPNKFEEKSTKSYATDLLYEFIDKIPNLKKEHYILLVKDPFEKPLYTYEDVEEARNRNETVIHNIVKLMDDRLLSYGTDQDTYYDIKKIIKYGSIESYDNHKRKSLGIR